jgi:hypothetical protein
MIEQTTVNGRPATVAYLGAAGAATVEPDQATLIKVRFTDAQGGIAFLNAGSRTSVTTSYLWSQAKRNALARLTLAQRAALARAQAEKTLARLKDFDEAQHPRDESGKWTDGGGDGGSGGASSGAKQTKPPKGAEHPGKGYSAHAWLDSKGVIHTSNVYDAQRALFEDRKVELSQVKQVSTLIQRLGETAAEMAEQGQSAPVFNLCNVTVKGTNLFCADQIGIPRAEMPVIPAKRTKDFIKHLKQLGYEVEKGKERAENLRASQSEISGEKVAIQMERIRKDGFYKRLVISKDDYILDGHHTWAGELGLDAKDNDLHDDKEVKIARVNIGITKLIEIADKWTKDEGIAKKPAGQKALKGGDWNEDEHPRDEDGKFTDSGGGGGGGSSKPAAVSAKPTAPQGELFPGKFPPIPEPGKPVSDDDFKEGSKVKLGSRITADKKAGFFKVWNEKVKEAPEEFRKEFMGGLDGTLVINTGYSDDPNVLSFSGQIHDAEGKSIGDFTRTIDFNENKASSDYFKLHSRDTGKDIGKQMLAANVAKYQELGLDSVSVHANIDVGGYAWARYGYVPTEDSWRDLTSNLYDKLGGISSGPPEEWELMSESQQDEVKTAWKNSTESEFYDGEVENWRDSGQALAQAKTDLAGTFDTFSEANSKWAYDGLMKVAVMADGDTTSVSLPKLLSDKGSSLDHVLANTTISYNDRRGDGEEDPDITIEPEATPELTDDQRAEVESALVEIFNKKAASNADDAEPPDYLRDSVSELQDEIWDSMKDRDKYRWAEDNSALPENESDSEIDPDDADSIRSLLDDGDPKAIWAIADSSAGKDMLLGSDWEGVIDLHDKETMDRFNAYVGKAKASPAQAAA